MAWDFLDSQFAWSRQILGFLVIEEHIEPPISLPHVGPWLCRAQSLIPGSSTATFSKSAPCQRRLLPVKHLPSSNCPRHDCADRQAWTGEPEKEMSGPVHRLFKLGTAPASGPQLGWRNFIAQKARFFDHLSHLPSPIAPGSIFAFVPISSYHGVNATTAIESSASTTSMAPTITERAAFLARLHFGVTVPLLALALVPFCARIYVRIWPVWRLGWDDAFIIAGLVGLILPNSSLPFLSCLTR